MITCLLSQFHARNCQHISHSMSRCPSKSSLKCARLFPPQAIAAIREVESSTCRTCCSRSEVLLVAKPRLRDLKHCRSRSSIAARLVFSIWMIAGGCWVCCISRMFWCRRRISRSSWMVRFKCWVNPSGWMIRRWSCAHSIWQCAGCKC